MMVHHTMNCKGIVRPKTLIAIVFLGIFTVFILQNTEVVEIKFLVWELSLSRVVLLFGSLAIGILVGYLFGWNPRSK